jgi:NAD(P)-dependent dehydrogenase (short-subunit alcohol dehydrogenase family)
MSLDQLFSLRGRVALVTGGAGIYGRQIVKGLAEAGALTYLASRNQASNEKLAAELACPGRSIVPLTFDQGSEESILALRDQIRERDDRVDVLVNNAVLRPMRRGYQDDASAFAESMRVNATGLFIICRAFGDMMTEQKRGSIINIGSIQGMVGPDPTIYRDTAMHGWFPDYFFHKGGMINFTRFLASYYGRWNIRCNCVSPGGFHTEDQDPRFARQYSEKTCLGRMAGDTDLVGTIVFLASDASLYVTAANIPVDGGYTAK